MGTQEAIAEDVGVEDALYIRYSIDNRAAIITIDHPPANAFNSQVIMELGTAFDEATADGQVKVIIITGAGQFFVAGADINEINAVKDDREGATALIKRGQDLFLKIEQSKKPVIAAINGRFALGGGNELAMACHIRLAEDSVQFGQPEIKLGIIPGAGGTIRLTRLIGPSKAKDLIYTGRFVDATEALALGIADRVVPEDELDAAALEYAGRLAAGPTVAIAAARRAITDGFGLPVPEALALETAGFDESFATDDAREGVAAFLDKREPGFSGQ